MHWHRFKGRQKSTGDYQGRPIITPSSPRSNSPECEFGVPAWCPMAEGKNETPGSKIAPRRMERGMRLSCDSPIPRSHGKDACLPPASPQPAPSRADLVGGVNSRVGMATSPCLRAPHQPATVSNAGQRAQTPGSQTKDFISHEKAVTRALPSLL